MRQVIAALALAGVILTGWAMPSAAQQGVVIQNNGVSSSDSAAGADNVRISNESGNGQSLSGGGVNNATGTVERVRERKDRGARNNAEAAPAEEYVAPAEEYVAPAEEYVAPAEGEYQAYADTGEYVEPVAAPEQSVVDVPTEQPNVLRLPSTGAGDPSILPLASAAMGFVVSALGAAALRRRPTG